MERRKFNNLMLGSMCSLAMPSVTENKIVRREISKSDRYPGITYYYSDFGNLSMIVLDRAIQILIDNIFNPYVMESTYATATHYHIMGGYWEKCNMTSQSMFTLWDLLRYQLQTLAVQQKLPDLHLHGVIESGGFSGRGELGRVKIRWVNQDWVRIDGNFKVSINRTQFMYSNDPVTWAGVIAHEMLHNLGHDHPDDDYRNYLQINAFEQSFIINADSSRYGPLPSAWGRY